MVFNAHEQSKYIEKSIDRFFRMFCKALVEECSNAPRKRTIQDFVDKYGKERPGYINYNEFKEIFVTHAKPNMKKSDTEVEEVKMKALFSLFDVQSRGIIQGRDFVSTVVNSTPQIALMERLGNKVRIGGERFLTALTEEF